MRLSEDKISHLSHLLTDGAERSGQASFPDKVKARNTAKRVLTEYVRMETEIDEAVRKRLTTYSRNLPEGSREWDVLYRKHFDEEVRKRWR